MECGSQEKKNNGLTNMRKLLSIVLFLPIFLQAQEQTLPVSKYGLPVINDIGLYKKLVVADPDNEMIDLRELIPGAKFDVRYATANNIVKKQVYPAADVFMRKPAALALLKAQEQLNKLGYGLLFYDGYRPYAVTVLFYETIKDTTFVADPRKGSRHNRGMAIDLSLYDLQTGQPLVMPSGYDETTERSFHDYLGADSIAKSNRKILRTTMEAVGFDIYKWEWWHYDFKGWQDAAVYDIWHNKIRKANAALAKKKST